MSDMFQEYKRAGMVWAMKNRDGGEGKQVRGDEGPDYLEPLCRCQAFTLPERGGFWAQSHIVWLKL